VDALFFFFFLKNNSKKSHSRRNQSEEIYSSFSIISHIQLGILPTQILFMKVSAANLANI
jgi:hypothetical protein